MLVVFVTCFDIKNALGPHRVYLCVLCDSWYKQWLCPCFPVRRILYQQVSRTSC